MCYLGGIWRRLEQLERIYGSCPSVDQLSRFAGVPNLGKPLLRAWATCADTGPVGIGTVVLKELAGENGGRFHTSCEEEIAKLLPQI